MILAFFGQQKGKEGKVNLLETVEKPKKRHLCPSDGSTLLTLQLCSG